MPDHGIRELLLQAAAEAQHAPSSGNVWADLVSRALADPRGTALVAVSVSAMVVVVVIVLGTYGVRAYREVRGGKRHTLPSNTPAQTPPNGTLAPGFDAGALALKVGQLEGRLSRLEETMEIELPKLHKRIGRTNVRLRKLMDTVTKLPAKAGEFIVNELRLQGVIQERRTINKPVEHDRRRAGGDSEP